MEEPPSMEELKTELTELRGNVSALVERIGELKKVELVLRKEIGELKGEVENQKGQINFLGEKNKMVNLASSVDPGERSAMKEKIRELVVEIDGCIAMLKS